jgi:hypothetical protein
MSAPGEFDSDEVQSAGWGEPKRASEPDGEPVNWPEPARFTSDPPPCRYRAGRGRPITVDRYGIRAGDRALRWTEMLDHREETEKGYVPGQIMTDPEDEWSLLRGCGPFGCLLGIVLVFIVRLWRQISHSGQPYRVKRLIIEPVPGETPLEIVMETESGRRERADRIRDLIHQACAATRRARSDR